MVGMAPNVLIIAFATPNSSFRIYENKFIKFIKLKLKL